MPVNSQSEGIGRRECGRGIATAVTQGEGRGHSLGRLGCLGKYSEAGVAVAGKVKHHDNLPRANSASQSGPSQSRQSIRSQAVAMMLVGLRNSPPSRPGGVGDAKVAHRVEERQDERVESREQRTERHLVGPQTSPATLAAANDDEDDDSSVLRR